MRKLTPLAIRRRIAKLKRTARELGVEFRDTDSHDVAELIQAETKMLVAIVRHNFQTWLREQITGQTRERELPSPVAWSRKTLGWNSSASQQITNG